MYDHTYIHCTGQLGVANIPVSFPLTVDKLRHYHTQL